MRLYVAILLAALVSLAGALLGFWWAAFPVCAVLGAAVRARARVIVPSGLAIGLLAWLVPLAAANLRYGVGATASSLAAIMGFGHQGVLPVALTLLVGTLLGGTGAWLGSAARGVLPLRARVDAPPNG